jgi:hypothetical protein
MEGKVKVTILAEKHLDQYTAGADESVPPLRRRHDGLFCRRPDQGSIQGYQYYKCFYRNIILLFYHGADVALPVAEGSRDFNHAISVHSDKKKDTS